MLAIKLVKSTSTFASFVSRAVGSPVLQTATVSHSTTKRPIQEDWAVYGRSYQQRRNVGMFEDWPVAFMLSQYACPQAVARSRSHASRRVVHYQISTIPCSTMKDKFKRPCPRGKLLLPRYPRSSSTGRTWCDPHILTSPADPSRYYDSFAALVSLSSLLVLTTYENSTLPY